MVQRKRRISHFRTMEAVSAGRLKKNFEAQTDRITKEAISAKLLQHGDEENDKDHTLMSISFVNSLIACAKRKDLFQGSKIHANIRDQGLLEKNTFLGNTLVSMYAKCGALARAQQAVDELPLRNVVSWNALIAGYVQYGHGKEALGCFQRMQSEGLWPNAITYICILKACSITQDVDMGKKIHDDLVSQGLLEKDVVLGTALINMYAKCGLLMKARNVLDELHVQDVVSWSALIAGYAQQGQGEEALSCFQRMRNEGCCPNAITYISILKACSIAQDADMGKKFHNEIISQGLLKKSIVLGNALIDMYAKCGLLMKARNILDELPIRDAVSWSALIAGYAQQGHGEEALSCFQRMRSEGFHPNAITYICILQVCGIMQDADMGQKIHDEIVSQGLSQKDVELGNALIDMYAKCGLLMKARNILNELSVRDAVSWSALIAGYTQQGHGEEALRCFQQMRSEGFRPNIITYIRTLKACGIVQDAGMGKKIHDEIIIEGLLKKSIMLGNALVDMYAKCGILVKARNVLDELPIRDVVSWSTLIAGYAQDGHGKEALNCFERMRREGFCPDAITYICVLKACGITQDADMGKKINTDIVSQGLLKKDVVLCNALVDMYAKCGLLMKAQNILDELPVRDVVSWSALIAGYTQQGHGEEALSCFQRMRNEGFCPNAITYISILKACGIVQDADMGKKIHDEISSQGLLKKSIVLGNALVDMYAKCGLLMKARNIHDDLPVRDVVSWSALIAGYAQQGHAEEALDCFEQMRHEGFCTNVVSWNALLGGYAQQGLVEEAVACFKWMQQEGTSPDFITFVNMLNACSHSGLVDEGQKYFDNMRNKYGITPEKEHYTCMVDLFGRAKLFDKAMRVIKMMPSPDYPPVWSALLGACRKWGNVMLGRFAFERTIQLDRCDAAPYVLMSNIYAAAGMQEEAQNIECMRIQNAAWKRPGRTCWVDACGSFHKFVVGDTKNP